MTSSQITATSHHQLYDTDFVEWADQTVELLRQGKFSALDIENLIIEVKDLGNRERKALRSQLTRLLMHLLKWQYQPEKPSNSWSLSIRDARKQIKRLVRDAPSLNNHLTEKFDLCYQDAVEDAVDETGLPLETFPTECPYTVEQAIDREFLPKE